MKPREKVNFLGSEGTSLYISRTAVKRLGRYLFVLFAEILFHSKWKHSQGSV